MIFGGGLGILLKMLYFFFFLFGLLLQLFSLCFLVVVCDWKCVGELFLIKLLMVKSFFWIVGIFDELDGFFLLFNWFLVLFLEFFLLEQVMFILLLFLFKLFNFIFGCFFELDRVFVLDLFLIWLQFFLLEFFIFFLW